MEENDKGRKYHNASLYFGLGADRMSVSYICIHCGIMLLDSYGKCGCFAEVRINNNCFPQCKWNDKFDTCKNILISEVLE